MCPKLSTRLSDNGMVVAEVTDSGAGMTSEQLEHVFDPFFTTKSTARGTGLGLTIARRIVHDHGGRIEAESIPGQGSTFRILLPVAGGPDETSTETEAPLAPRGVRRLRILVIDDEQSVRELNVRALDEHEIECATSGRHGLELLAQDPVRDMVLCDIMMPDLTGPAVYERVRQRHPELADRFVFITGGIFSDDAQRFLDNEELPRLLKPLGVSALRRLVATLVRPP